MRRLSAGTMALAGFVVALLAGMQAENPTGRVIVTAIVALVACHIAGTILGMVIERVLNEHQLAVSNEYRQEQETHEVSSEEDSVIPEATEVEPEKKAA
ncbi:MAG: hypothetical protein ED559_04555 [Phycisphaera sp.]|nr:MAG: hypothetical protein ED559_04555 [Phycisphaera sp.]